MTKAILTMFWTHTWRYKWRALIIVLLVVISVATDISMPWFLGALIDTMSTAVDPISAGPAAFRSVGIIAVLYFIGWVTWRIVGFMTADFQPRVMQDLEEHSFNYLLGHSFGFFTNQFAGSLVRRIRRVSRAYEKFADEVQFRFIMVAVVLVGALIAFGTRFPFLAVVFFIWVLVFLYLNYRISCWVLLVDTERAAKDSEVTGMIADALTNNAPIKTYTGENVERGYLHHVEEAFRALQTKAWNRNELSFTVQTILIIIMEVAVLAFSVRLWQRGIISVGDFVLIQSTLVIVVSKIWDINRAFRHVFEAFADASEMMELLLLPHEITDKKNAAQLSVPKGEIVFEKVNFQYHKTRRVLNAFDLAIKSREKVAFVGPSGAGKSTIVKLLFRFVDPTSGAILIDGQKIRGVTQDSLRSHIALVPQDPILFHRSLMENIRYGRRDATDEEVIEAAKKAHCHEFIDELPKKYDTLVGERGIKLSGGERQRVAIARAILKNPPILVLDEATSNLDSESEHYIQEALFELMKDKTVIVIAHRLSTIMRMDRIIVLEKGKITATGSHAALLKRTGTYRRLWNIQAGGFAKQHVG